MKNVKIKTNTTTPVSTATTATTPDTTAMDVAGSCSIALLKTFAGLAVGALATALTGKLLKTGASQKAYEEVLKEFTSK